jgi:hypothetical protein
MLRLAQIFRANGVLWFLRHTSAIVRVAPYSRGGVTVAQDGCRIAVFLKRNYLD